MRYFRAYQIEILLVLVLALAVAFFGYLGYGLIPSNTFSGERALAQAQAQIAFGPRVTGTEGNIRASNALTQELTSLGWDVVIQPITLTNTIVARNIIAIHNSSNANAPVGILGAHYDSRAVADADTVVANRTSPSPGANDNASGVAILLELARALDVNATGHTVCLVFFDADDDANLTGWQPLVGSTNFAQALKEANFPCRMPQFAVIVDMVGNDNQKFYIDKSSHVGLSRAIWQAAAKIGQGNRLVPQLIDPIDGAHTPFIQAGIPTTILYGLNYPYQHTMGDTVDKISAASLAAIGSTLESWLEAGATFTQR